MKSLLIATLLVISTVALAGGDQRTQGIPAGTGFGDSNEGDTQRSLLVKCPEGTTLDSVETQPDPEGAVVTIECNWAE